MCVNPVSSIGAQASPLHAPPSTAQQDVYPGCARVIVLQVWTEKGVVYVAPSGGGLLEGQAYAVAKTHTTIGPFQKGDDVSSSLLEPSCISYTVTWRRWRAACDVHAFAIGWHAVRNRAFMHLLGMYLSTCDCS